MRNHWSYRMLPLLLFMMAACKLPQRNLLPPMEESYKKDDKNPFGAYQAFNRLVDFFDNVRVVYGTANSLERDSSQAIGHRDHSLYLLIADKLSFSEEEATWLYNYVKQGNELFVSANEIDQRFLTLFECESNQKMAHLNDRPGHMTNTSTSISFGDNLPLLTYGYYYYPFADYIKSYQKDNTRVLGVNEKQLPNFAIIFVGKGRLYLHLSPRAFSNYFFLTAHNQDYVNYIFSYFKPKPSAVYWDEYYKIPQRKRDDKKKDNKDFGTLQVIMQHPLLKWAFWIMAAGFCFFIFSNTKRLQRIIPVEKKPVNASVDFVETMGRLYFVNKDNRNIAIKLITYFREFVRSKYFIRGAGIDEDFAKILAAKRGISPDQTRELLHCITQIEQEDGEISDAKLIRLNTLLEKFYKR